PLTPMIQPRRRPAKIRTSGYMTVLLFLLAFASMACFASAYCLFKTRWGVPVVRESQHATDLAVKVIEFDDTLPAVAPQELFLAYLPHSGFHNQRIAFENALTLARLLNRTLLVPPIRLAESSLPYYPFDTLYLIHSDSERSELLHCSEVSVDFYPE